VPIVRFYRRTATSPCSRGILTNGSSCMPLI